MRFNKKQICGVVVLYNPDRDVVESIRTYSDQVDHLFIVDNSDNPADIRVIDSLRKIRNSEYISNGKNIGIAAALNIGAKRGLKSGYKYILTMDQDSKAPENMVGNMFMYLDRHYSETDRIGIVTPFQNDKGSPVIPDDDVEECGRAITSGNVLNLKIYSTVGEFDECLFIDKVDDDYCLRLRAEGYKIIRVNKVILDHNLGNISHHMFLWRPQVTTNHSPVRRYYITRNSFYVAKKHKKNFNDYYRFQLKTLFYEFVKIILYEKMKIKKIKAVILGYSDYRRNKMGKYQDIHRISL